MVSSPKHSDGARDIMRAISTIHNQKERVMSIFDFKKGLIKLGDGVWAYIQPDGSWGLSNAGLMIDQNKSLLVDTLCDVNLTNEMLTTMREVTPEAETIDFLINTHDDGEHWFGNEAAWAGEIISTKACAKAMAGFTPEAMAEIMKQTSNLGDLEKFYLKHFGKFSFDNIAVALPSWTFEGRMELEVGSKKVELIEVGPCHSAGDLIVHIPHARTVFVGDIMIMGGHQIMWTGPVANFIKAIDLIISLEPKHIVPGHGPVTGTQGALEIKEYWEYYAHEAGRRYDQGMEVFAAAKDIPIGPYAEFHNPEKIVVNVNALYKEFSNKSDPIIQEEQFTLISNW